MKTSLPLATLIYLAAHFASVLPSNPDSEIVQSTSEEVVEDLSFEMVDPEAQGGLQGGSRSPKSSALRNDADGARKAGDTASEPIFRELRPIATASGIVWRVFRLPSTLESEFVSRYNRYKFRNQTVRRETLDDRVGQMPDRAGSGQRKPFRPPETAGQGVKRDVPPIESSGRPSSAWGSRFPQGGYVPPLGPGRIPPPPQRDRDRIPRPSSRPRATQGPQVVVPGGAGRPPPGQKASADSNLFAGMVNDFAFKMVERMNLQESNFVVSPLSLFVSVSMLYLGSEGKTKAQLERVLELDRNSVHDEHLHQGIRDLLNLVNASKANTIHELSVANGLFLGQDFAAEPQFVEQVRRYYDAELAHVDFSDPTVSTRVINEWVSQRTDGKISSLIDRSPGLLTRLLLANAVYFRGAWKTQFPLDLTYSGWFNTPGGETKEVTTMALYNETFPMHRNDDLRHTFLKLPYDGEQVSMLIALPYHSSDPVMPAVRDETLCHAMDALEDTQLRHIGLPKFKLEYSAQLREALERLGARDVFQPAAADLRRLRRKKDLSVASILHKALMEVNEEGTTASAVTGVRFVALNLKNTTDFVVDRPFAFYLMHEASGLVLFYGKIYDLGKRSSSPQGSRGHRNPNAPPMRRRPNGGLPLSLPKKDEDNVPEEDLTDVPDKNPADVPDEILADVPVKDQTDVPNDEPPCVPDGDQSNTIEGNQADVPEKARADVPAGDQADSPDEDRANVPNGDPPESEQRNDPGVNDQADVPTSVPSKICNKVATSSATSPQKSPLQLMSSRKISSWVPLHGQLTFEDNKR